ncbi:MAG: NAD(P)/FAD-dependent oxidoreductase [Anaerolineae bacterium]|nr:NAD(P)/FAD-dependent oxidoreductase [Anaerolineae bacterium]
MQIAIIGAGIAGLTAAYDLTRAGHQVTVYEAAAQAGGLASGFRDTRWDWPLERFYHHIFTTDQAIIDLTRAIGFEHALFFPRPLTAQWWGERGYALTGSRPAVTLPGRGRVELPVPDLVAGGLSVLGYPGLPFVDRVRLNLVLAYLKLAVRDWRPLEQETAARWARRWGGETLYREFFQPLLEGKFGPYAEQVNMSWLWARFKTRSVRLGYYVGGFQALSDHLMAAVQKLGATVLLQTPIQALTPLPDGRWQVAAPIAPETGARDFDAVIVTGSPGLLSKLAPQLPPSYLGQLKELRSLGAVVMTIALKQPLTGGLYWVNLPKTQFPFLALVEHTNFIPREHYGGDHLVYCGDYLDPSHEYFRLSQDELLQRFLPALQRVNPRFEPSWVRDVWLHREPYAQPIVPVNHSRHIPPLTTPLPGLFWASMSQVYPWDRGTNFAVEIGQRVAREVLQSDLARSTLTERGYAVAGRGPEDPR